MAETKMSNVETFRLAMPPGEVFAEEVDGRKVVRGYAVKWNDVGDRYGDGTLLVQFAKGAFKNTLANADHEAAFLQEHEGPALASTRNGSLALREDKTGLAYTAKLNTDISDARDAYLRVVDGISNRISVGVTLDFNNMEIQSSDDDDNSVLVVYKNVSNLWEISLVHSPVFEDTDATARNALNFALAREQATSTATDGQLLARALGAKLDVLQRVQVGGNHPA